jgi:Uma2 family endonuclease
VLLLVEVADSCIETDSGANRELYARVGIRQFWIVDLTTDCVLVHRKPSGDRYELVTPVEWSGVLDVEDLPRVTLPAASLFS